MATINGLTATRLLQLEADTVIGAHISGDNLILEQHDGSTIDVGVVRGSPGVSDLTLYDPVGVPKPYVGATAPTGYGLCDASTQYVAATYPILAGLFGTGASCVNGASAAGNFRLPNLKGKTLVGLDPAAAPFDTLHETGGSRDAIVVTHGHPGSTSDQLGHNHVADQTGHAHTNTAAAEDDPSPAISGDVFAVSTGNVENQRIPDAGSTSNGVYVTFTSVDGGGTHNHGMSTEDPAISVSTEDPAITTSIANAGISGTDKNLPPYRVVNFIMRLA